MKWLKRLAWTGLILIVLLLSSLAVLPYLNDYQKEGELTVPGLRDAVAVKRDEKGMAYIYAQNLPDALMAQGFVTAQDRLFQMHLIRLLTQGRMSELAGEKARSLDLHWRTIGLHRIAKKQVKILDKKTRNYFQDYADGVNAFIENCPADMALEFSLVGVRPEPWTVLDSVCVLYYMAFSTSANLRHEVVAQMLVERVGRSRAEEILPVNLNPDDPLDLGDPAPIPSDLATGFRPTTAGSLADTAFAPPLALGSNNWVVSSPLSPGGKPILASDPHLDPRILPGVWYPVGLITPEVRAVGANVPGLPGMIVGRTGSIAIAPTNNYGDMQDLYVETLDPARPGHYLEGEVSLPFEVITESLRIKDKESPEGFRQEQFEIRLTRRGPVVSDVLPGLSTDRVITLRWAPAEKMQRSLDFSRILAANSTTDLHGALAEVPMLCLNFVFADSAGNIGYRASGSIPIRSQGSATFPHLVTGEQDNWTGWISHAEMPHNDNPLRGWLGTCNQKTVPHNYPFYYSSYFSPSYRYRRLEELMERPGPKSVDFHWQAQRDVKNLMAEKIAPIMATALLTDEQTREMGEILSSWNFVDEPHLIAPTIFQATYINFARAVFEDELGPELTTTLLRNWYFWQERLQRMMLSRSSGWFDDRSTTGRVETLNDLLRRAALKTRTQLEARIGNDMESWLWGKLHTLELVSPIRRTGLGKGLLGSGTMPFGGSGETLFRGMYELSEPFSVIHCASLRMVADLADPDKVAAVLPGGVTGRLFSSHQKDQIDDFMEGRKVYWWFSDKAIGEHTEHTLALKP